MADKRISELNAITGANTADGDLFVIVDVDASETKKITKSELFNQDITIGGTVTADGLTVDGDSQTTTLKINTASSAWADANADDLIIRGTDVGVTLSSTGTGNLYFGDGTGAQKQGQIKYTHSSDSFDIHSAETKRLTIAGNGDISFYEDTGTTAKFFWDASAESLGIGTSDPVEQFTVGATTTTAGFSLGSATTQVFLRYNNYFSGTAQVSDATKGSASISLGRSSDGVITFNTAAAGAGTPTEAMRIASDGSCRWTPDGTNADMTLDASGNLLVGRTSVGGTGNGHSIRGGDSAIFSRDASGETVQIGRNSSDGQLVRFNSNGSSVGSIGVTSNRMFVGTGDSGLFFNDQTDAIQPWNTSTNAPRDAGIDLGASDRRFKDLYLSGGVNQNNNCVQFSKNAISINTSTATEILRISAATNTRTACIVKVTFAHENGFSVTSGSISAGTFFFLFQNFSNVAATVSSIINSQTTTIVATRAIGTTFSFNTIDSHTIALEATATGYGTGDSITCSYEIVAGYGSISELGIT